MARGKITLDQFKYLIMRIKSSRVLQREGKYSYLASWDVRAQLIRVFGYGNFDVTVERERLLGVHNYTSGSGDRQRAMAEVMWQATVLLILRDPEGNEIARYQEAAVGSANGGAEGSGMGDLHDNALKSAVSDAMKRCCINLGNQFGLSLYDNGNMQDVVRATLVLPEDYEQPSDEPKGDAAATLSEKLGAEQVTPPQDESPRGWPTDEQQRAAARAVRDDTTQEEATDAVGPRP